MGGGGHGKVVADLLRACGHEAAGFVATNPAKLGQVVEPDGARVILDQDELLGRPAAASGLPAAGALALAVGSNAGSDGPRSSSPNCDQLGAVIGAR